MTTRALTDGEIALAKEIYGDSIEYSDVKVHSDRYYIFQSKGLSMSPNGELYMYGTYLDDFSKGSALQRALFIHEMGHVWQIQNKVLNLVEAAVDIHLKNSFNYKSGYYYTLEKGKDLTEYNMEQQASIIEDYFVLKHEKLRSYKGVCRNEEPLDARIALYESVLEKFLADPAYARRENYFQRPRRIQPETPSPAAKDSQPRILKLPKWLKKKPPGL
jgi:hypothetical protein